MKGSFSGGTDLYQGDVQTTVMIHLTVGCWLSEQKRCAEESFHAYVGNLDAQMTTVSQASIDLLQRFQLYAIATEITKASPFFSVRRLNQESTTVHTSCSSCFKPLLVSKVGYWYCDRCKHLLGPCSVWYVDCLAHVYSITFTLKAISQLNRPILGVKVVVTAVIWNT